MVDGDMVVNAVNVAPTSRSSMTSSGEVIDTTSKRQDGDWWDFALTAHRNDAINMMRNMQPISFIGTSRHVEKDSRGSSENNRRTEEVKQGVHMEFSSHLYKQDEEDRYFVHEQMNGNGVELRKGFKNIQDINGITATVEAKKYKDIKLKMVKIFTNNECIASRIAGSSVSIRGGVRHRTERKDLCRDVRRGLRSQMEIDDAMELDACESGEQEFYDAVTGEKLNGKLVKQARAEEIEYYRNMKVYTKISRQWATSKTGKAPIKVRWVDHNKGTAERPMIRSRLVAKEIKVCDRPELFAATPPL